MYNFYGQNVTTPLSLANRMPNWSNSVLGELHAKTSGAVALDELEGAQLNASFAWRVVDATWSQEDESITYFRAFDLYGRMLPEATFGVAFGGAGQISGGFKYPLKAGNKYYIPQSNSMPTFNAGGYTVVVLDLDLPSEGLQFGQYMQGDQHQNLTISFRLFELGEGYPNDLSIPPR